MTKQELLSRVSKLNIWQKGDQRAPHKPLLLLLSLARLQNGQERLALFSDIEPSLTELLIEFGPHRKSHHPEEPFCRLRSDGIWELVARDNVLLPETGSMTKTFLRKESVKGGFTEDIHQLIKANPELIEAIANFLLQSHFPETIHQDILDAVGLNLEANLTQETPLTSRRSRDPAFRKKILQAYNSRCAICGFDVRMGNTPIALEAAHIKWFQAGGPDTENNGLALCSMHHKLLDRGALAISETLTVMVSENASGYFGYQEWLLDFEGKELRMPKRDEYLPDVRFTKWHVREVYKEFSI